MCNFTKNEECNSAVFLILLIPHKLWKPKIFPHGFYCMPFGIFIISFVFCNICNIRKCTMLLPIIISNSVSVILNKTYIA